MLRPAAVVAWTNGQIHVSRTPTRSAVPQAECRGSAWSFRRTWSGRRRPRATAPHEAFPGANRFGVEPFTSVTYTASAWPDWRAIIRIRCPSGNHSAHRDWIPSECNMRTRPGPTGTIWTRCAGSSESTTNVHFLSGVMSVPYPPPVRRIRAFAMRNGARRFRKTPDDPELPE